MSPDDPLPPAATAAIGPVRRLLGDVRRRTRRTLLVRAAAWSVAALCGAVILSFALDYALDLPVAVRGVHLALSLVALGAAIAWATGPLRRPIADAELAAGIERDVPDFEDRLVSSLDFEGRIADPDEPESRTMMAAAVGEASAIAARLDAGLLVDGRPARRAATAAVAALAVVGAVQAAFPVHFALWIRRGLLLADVSWPRRTTVRILDVPESGPIVVTRGDDLRIVAEVDGDRPDDLDLHIEEFADPAEGASPDADPEVAFRDVRKMFAVPDEAGRYAFELRSVASSFRFWVTGGDDLDRRPVVEVRALVPPRVASFEARVEYPAHTRLPTATFREPHVEALAGSKVELEFKANMPVRSLRILPSDAAAVDLTVGPDGRTATWRLEAVKSVEFHVELTAEAGHVNRPDDDVFRIDAVDDRVPVVRVLYPYERLTRTPEGIVPLKVIAEDDFGLAGVDLSVRQGANAATSMRIWPRPGAAAADGSAADGGAPADGAPVAKRTHVYLPLDLRAFAGDGGVDVKSGDVLTLDVRAADSAGGASEPRDVTVEIVALEELETKLQQQMTKLREDLSAVRRAQRKTVAAVREVRDAVAGSTPDASVVRRVRDLQVDQGRVTADVGRFLTGIHRVFDGHVLNRAGSVPTIDRLLPLYDAALAAPPDDSGDVFPATLYDAILTEKRANRIYDPEVLGTLLDVMDLGEDVRSVRGPAAYDALDRFGAGTAADPRALVDADLAATEVLAALDRIDERMQRFEDLSELVRMAREIHEAQKALSNDPRGASQPGKDK